MHLFGLEHADGVWVEWVPVELERRHIELFELGRLVLGRLVFGRLVFGRLVFGRAVSREGWELLVLLRVLQQQLHLQHLQVSRRDGLQRSFVNAAGSSAA